MDKNFIYAILASSLIHGMVILLWPRMTQPKIEEFGNITGLVPIEYLTSFDLNTGADRGKDDSNPPEREKDPDDILKAGEMITDRIIEGRGNRSLENISGHDLSIPHVRLPKQAIMPAEDEYATLWPEEFTESTQKDTQAFLHPESEIKHKDIFTDLSNADISSSLMLDEFPEEMPSQQSPDIIWEGTPRTWVTKPEKPPTYRGDEEGLVKLRFWVNKNGEVVNAIPIQKLSVELEEKALAYIFSWRFEPSMNIPLQEGIIRINFRLDQYR